MAEQKHLGRIKLQPGQSLFCLNIKTGDITNMGRPKRVDVEEACVYRTELNRKSFVKKLIRHGIIKVVPKQEAQDETEST
jgi:hypothetical protein